MMQKISALIKKLQELHENGADLQQLLTTAQMLQQEINGALKETVLLGTSKVSVFLPNAMNTLTVKTNIPEQGEGDLQEKEVYELKLDVNVYDDETEEEDAESLNIPDYETVQAIVKDAPAGNELVNPAFFLTDEIPTLSQYLQEPEPAREVKPKPRSNDFAAIISEKDKAVFVERLFRGDENTYERSLKTISNFKTFADAELWIKRELKTKIGWPPDDEAVQRFDDAVMTRFS